jgi:hypothetical protein
MGKTQNDEGLTSKFHSSWHDKCGEWVDERDGQTSNPTSIILI